MYIEKTKKITLSHVKKELNKIIAEKLEKGYGTKRERDDIKEAMASQNNHHFNSLCNQLVELNNALLSGRSVFAICEKQPKGNLDSGRHYYSVYYTNKKGIVDKIWGYGLYSVIGQESQDRDRNMWKYIFGSGCIGMSRLLDATDGLFGTLKAVGGCYTQIDCK